MKGITGGRCGRLKGGENILKFGLDESGRTANPGLNTRQSRPSVADCYLAHPPLHARNGAIQVISDLINPKPHYIPSEFHEPLISDLVAPRQLAIPRTVVHFSIDLDIQAAVTFDKREVEGVLINIILWYRTNSRPIERTVKYLFPTRHSFRSRHCGIIGTKGFGAPTRCRGWTTETLDIVCKVFEIGNSATFFDQLISLFMRSDVTEVKSSS